jgi:hypothetical protein
MKKHKFGVTCTSKIFVETALGPREDEKLYVDVSHAGHIGMHYVPRRSLRMRKHKFGVTCPDGLFVESIPTPREDEKNVSTFHALDVPECTTGPTKSTICKNTSLV